MTDRQRQEFRRLDKVLRTFNIWKKRYKTYVSLEDEQKAYNAAIEYLGREKARVSGARIKGEHKVNSATKTKNTEPDYKGMWLELKNRIKADKAMYDDGTMCSLNESMFGSTINGNVLKTMKKIEQNRLNSHN